MLLIVIDPFVLLYYQHLATQLISVLHYVEISLLQVFPSPNGGT